MNTLPPARARTSSRPWPAGAWPPARLQMLREYPRLREFRRDAAQLARNGWYPIAVKTSDLPGVLRALDALSFGLLSLLTRARPPVLVTYSTR